MTPERVAGLVARWVRFYTRDLPPPVAERRIGEIDADLHDHITHERSRATEDRRIALGIAARMVRGLAADVSWRSSTKKEVMPMSTPTRRSVLRVALVTALILGANLVAMQFSDGVDWGVFDFLFAALLLGVAGALIELAVRRPRSLVFRIAAAVLGVAAIVLGEADDAPGLVGFGCLLILGAIALTVRTALRRA